MEYQKNSRQSHDSIIEWVKLWGFGLVLPQSCSAARPWPQGWSRGLSCSQPNWRELFQARAVLGLGALAELPHGFCSVGGGRD